MAAVYFNSCSKEKSFDTSNGSNSSGSSALLGNWKLLYTTSDGYETGEYTQGGIAVKDIYKFKDSSINNSGIFAFSKDSLAFKAVAFNQVGYEWIYTYANGVLMYSDSSDYNEPITMNETIPYKVKGDSIQLLDDSGVFGGSMPGMYKYTIIGNKLTLTGRFIFTIKDTSTSYIETYNINIGANIYLQKQ
jgi:hypothetical protein